jgi:hypothetical protein
MRGQSSPRSRVQRDSTDDDPVGDAVCDAVCDADDDATVPVEVTWLVMVGFVESDFPGTAVVPTCVGSLALQHVEAIMSRITPQ